MKIDFQPVAVCVALVTVLLSSFIAEAGSVGTGPSFKGPVGLQLYSLREQFKKDVPSTLDEVKKWGIKYAELAGTYDLPPEKFKHELEARGVQAIGAETSHTDARLEKREKCATSTGTSFFTCIL